MRFTESSISNVYVLEPEVFSDDRGEILKVFQQELFLRNGLPFECAEVFFSTSAKNVIRGFHFQSPPMAVAKVAWVTEGEILDVVVDLRKGSPTYGQCYSAVLSAANRKVMYVPEGIGHAFGVLSDRATVLYLMSRSFSPAHDAGVRWDSVGFEWPIEKPILSAKDARLPLLRDFDSPFTAPSGGPAARES